MALELASELCCRTQAVRELARGTCHVRARAFRSSVHFYTLSHDSQLVELKATLFSKQREVRSKEKKTHGADGGTLTTNTVSEKV